MTLKFFDGFISLAYAISFYWVFVPTAAVPCAQYTPNTDLPLKNQSKCDCDGNILVSCDVIPYYNELDASYVSVTFDSFDGFTPKLKQSNARIITIKKV